jgi:hypothetical protein
MAIFQLRKYCIQLCMGRYTQHLQYMTNKGVLVTILHGRTTRVWVAGCCVHFPKDAAYVSAKCGYPCAALFGIFPWVLHIFL